MNVAFTLQTTFALPSHLDELGLFSDQTPLDTGYASRTLTLLPRQSGTGYWCALSILSVMKSPDANSGHGQRRATGENAAFTILRMYNPVGRNIVACDLCSTSGRLAYMVREKSDIELFVVDYLSA